MVSQAQFGSRSHGTTKAVVRRRKKRGKAIRISMRAPWGNGMIPMRTVPSATRAKSGSRTRVGPEKPGILDPFDSTCPPRAPTTALSPVAGCEDVLMTELRSPCPRAIAVSEPSHRLDGPIVLITPTEFAPEAQDGVFHA